MGVSAWSPLAKGFLTGKYRKGQPQPDTLRAKYFPKMMSDKRSLEVIDRLIPLAQDAGMSLPHMAIAFVLAHPGITSAIIGPRTMEQFDDLLAGAGVTLEGALLDRIDEIAPPGADIALLEGSAYTPPAIKLAELRRRPIQERARSVDRPVFVADYVTCVYT